MMTIFLILFGFIFGGIGMYLLAKPEQLKRRCTEVTEGTVAGYNSKDDGGRDIVSDSSMDDVDMGIRRPITQYDLNGSTYTAIGPVYMCYTDTHLEAYPGEQGTVEFRNGEIHAHMVRDHWKVHPFNPYEKVVPVGTKVTVHYDPENPGVSYVNEVPKEKWLGRIFLLIGLGILAAAIIVSLVG